MKTIAIIEDDQPIGDLLEEALGQAGYATLRAYSGTEAQYLLERAKPDLILLDLMLPGLTGGSFWPALPSSFGGPGARRYLVSPLRT